MSYLGSKAASGAFQAIIAAMCVHDTYIETHLGTGAVLRNKPPAERSIACEIDAATLAEFPPPAGVEVHLGDCVRFLEAFDFEAAGRVLVYADPPYLESTRSSRRYRHDYTVADHKQLLAVLQRIPAAVILSGYPSDLYDRLLVGWRTIEFQVMTRGGPRTEKLWLNYSADLGVQWHTFAGRDFIDRQRIKRKAARWAENFRALPPGERLAILAALLEETGARTDVDVYAAGGTDEGIYGGLGRGRHRH